METMQWISVESYEYEGPVALCCGPSGAEKSLASSEQSFSNLLQADFGSRFANQTNLLNSLNQSLSPITAAGPSQEGWSPQEAAAISTATINNAGAAARNATQAVQGALAGRGGDSGLESGVDKQILAGVKSNAANTLANQQTQNTIADYNQGTQNYWRAIGGQQILASLQNPEQFGSQAISANQGAFNEADQIQQQQNQEEAAIAGGITGLAENFVAPGLSNLDSTGGSSGGEQIWNFFKGAAGQ